MKFDDEEEFLKTLNQWVRDGSDILEVTASSMGTVVTLMGKDGCRECLALFHSKEDFNRSMMFSQADLAVTEVPKNA